MNNQMGFTDLFPLQTDEKYDEGYSNFPYVSKTEYHSIFGIGRGRKLTKKKQKADDRLERFCTRRPNSRWCQSGA